MLKKKKNKMKPRNERGVVALARRGHDGNKEWPLTSSLPLHGVRERKDFLKKKNSFFLLFIQIEKQNYSTKSQHLI